MGVAGGGGVELKQRWFSSGTAASKSKRGFWKAGACQNTRAHGLHISAVGFYFAYNKGGGGGNRHCITSKQCLRQNKEAGSLPQAWLYFPPHVLRLRASSYTLYKTGTAGGGITSGTVCGSVCMNLHTCTCVHVLAVINVPSPPYCSLSFNACTDVQVTGSFCQESTRQRDTTRILSLLQEAAGKNLDAEIHVDVYWCKPSSQTIKPSPIWCQSPSRTMWATTPQQTTHGTRSKVSTRPQNAPDLNLIGL